MKQKFGQAPAKQSLTTYTDVLRFGKHKGKTVEWILEHDPSYLVWLDDNKLVALSQEIYNTAEIYAEEEADDYFGGDMGSTWDYMGDDD